VTTVVPREVVELPVPPNVVPG